MSHPWQPIGTAPKGNPGFLATDDYFSCIEWLTDYGDERAFFSVNSGTFTDREHWKFWTPLPRFSTSVQEGT